MSCATLDISRVGPAENFEDEIVALTLQLEELRDRDVFHKGKYPEGQPPDATRALLEYEIEIVTCLQTMTDLKLAHSIAHAVDTDGPIIETLISVESQAEEDRRVAIQKSTDDPELVSPLTPPPFAEIGPIPPFKVDYQQYMPGSQWDISTVFDDDSTTQLAEDEDHGEQSAYRDSQAMTYTKRQAAALDTLGSLDSECCACSERLRPFNALRLECNDVFCRACLIRVIMVSIQDKSTFPPSCCRRAIPQATLQGLLSEQELQDFKDTEIEVSCAIKTYCSNSSCGKFIPPAQITADRAHCLRCGSLTCTHCKNATHDNDCPEDDALKATLALAADEGWQRCFSCQAVVMLAKACNHMTCRCGAEFCYLCGLKWKTCPCDAWLERNIIDRAEEVVDREAAHPLQAQERQRRVELMRDELLETHECEHPGRFERIFNGPRRGFRCEMCDVRHRKYILQCRRCHLQVCESCRRHRI